MTDKQVIYQLLESLPESASLDQIVQEVNILAKIQCSRAEVVAGKIKTHEEVKALMASWATTWRTRT